MSDDLRCQCRLQHLRVHFEFGMKTMQFVERTYDAETKRSVPLQKILLQYARRRCRPRTPKYRWYFSPGCGRDRGVGQMVSQRTHNRILESPQGFRGLRSQFVISKKIQQIRNHPAFAEFPDRLNGFTCY